MFQTRDLGLAAYILTKGYKLYKCEDKNFTFESFYEPVSENCDEMSELRELRELSVEYANSCCRKHDVNLLFLKSLLTMKGKNHE